jgi:hypothetical protein
MKKTADQFIEDAFDGTFASISGSPDEIQAKIADLIESDYSFSQDDLQEAVNRSREKIEAAIGVKLTDEQLAALSGGKSDGQKIGLGAGIGGAVAVGGAAAAGAAVGTYVLIAILVK